MKPEEMIEICAEIEIHYRSKRTDEDRTAWVHSMIGLFGLHDKKTLKNALKICLKTCEFEPRPSDIQKAIDIINKSEEPILTPEEIFSKLTEKARWGWSEERLFACLENLGLKQILRAVKAVGWKKISYSFLEDQKWIRKEFISVYEKIIADVTETREREKLISPSVSKLLQDMPVKRIQ